MNVGVLPEFEASVPTSSSLAFSDSFRSEDTQNITVEPAKKKSQFQCAPEQDDQHSASYTLSSDGIGDSEDNVFQRRKYLLKFFDPCLEKEFLQFQHDETKFVAQLGQLVLAGAEAIVALVICASESTRDNFIPWILCCASIIECVITLCILNTSICGKSSPWKLFLMITFSTLFGGISGMAALFISYDYWLDGAIVAPVLGVGSVFVSMVKMPFFLSSLVSGVIACVYITTMLCGIDYNTVNISNLLQVALEVGFLSLTFAVASWSNERSLRNSWTLMRANLNLTQNNRKLKDVISEISEQESASLDLNSPVEKALRVLKDMKKLSELGQISQRKLIGRIAYLLKLLSSTSNILAPDISKQLASNKVAIDEETKAWLLTELGKQKAKSNSLDSLPETFPCNKNPSTVPKTIFNLTDWSWNIFESDCYEKPLVSVTYNVMSMCTESFQTKFNPNKIVGFLNTLEAKYLANPFHNSLHAADVVQAICAFLASGLQKQLTQVEVLALLFAAAVHDVAHPGLTNAFQIATHSELALLYNDKSVLENHHCSVAFKLLQDDDVNLCDTMSLQQFSEFRSLVIELVLATDMALHMDLVSAFKARASSGLSLDLVSKTKADRLLLMKIALKSADISNVARPLHIYSKWTTKLTEEFFNQGDVEVEKGMSVSPFMDRNNFELKKSQLGFLEFIAVPLWSSFAAFMGDGFLHLMENVTANLQHWQDFV